MTSLFADIDVHLTPTALTGALRLGEDFGSYIDVVNTPCWNSVGYPAMSIPMGQTSEGLPVGLQLAGRPFEESTVLRAADAYQFHTDHHLVELGGRHGQASSLEQHGGGGGLGEVPMMKEEEPQLIFSPYG